MEGEKCRREEVEMAVRYISEHFLENICWETAAEEIPLSNDRVRKIFKEETGTTMHRYIKDMRMESAARMLRDTDLSVAEIGEATCHKTAAYFTHCFRRKYGQTPLRYRRSMRQNRDRRKI